MIQRRNFLGGIAGILASGFAPAAIGSGVLMPVRRIVVPQLAFGEFARIVGGDGIVYEVGLWGDGPLPLIDIKPGHPNLTRIWVNGELVWKSREAAR